MHDFQRALGETNGPAAQPNALVVIQHQRWYPPLPQIKRKGQTDRPRPDDHHWMVRRRCGILIRRTRIGIKLEGKRIALIQHG